MLDLVYFLVGLGIGLLQLYVGQRHFEAQQQQRMDEIRMTLADMAKRIAILQEVSSQRAFDVQDRLISLAAKEEAIAEITEETREEIRILITDELRKVGVSDDQTHELQDKIAESLQRSSRSLVEIVLEDTPELTPRQLEVLELVLEGHGTRAIAGNLEIGMTATRDLLARIYKKAGVTSRKELIAKYRAARGDNSDMSS